jgi:catechol 2,3-dioxygenase-like lactoylglutathione lyase family enzyme
MLQIHDDDSFLRMVQAGGAPASERRLPTPGQFNLELDRLSQLVDEHDSRVVGPPLEEDQARPFVGPTMSGPGPVNHVALGVTDLRRSEPWYCNALGLIRVDGEAAEDGAGHLVLASPTGGWMLTLEAPTSPAVQHVAFTCQDRAALAACRDGVAERGITPGTITDAPYGSGFVLRDPDGIELELFAPAGG